MLDQKQETEIKIGISAVISRNGLTEEEETEEEGEEAVIVEGGCSGWLRSSSIMYKRYNYNKYSRYFSQLTFSVNILY